MDKSLIECSRIAAAAKTATEAKREAKKRGLVQAEAARIFSAIVERRKEKAERLRMRRFPRHNFLHKNITAGNFRERAAYHVAEKRIFPRLWWPIRRKFIVQIGEELKIEYNNFYDGNYSGRNGYHFKKMKWNICITIPKDFMSKPICAETFDGLPCLVHHAKVLPNGVRMIKASIIHSPRGVGSVEFRPCWIAVFGPFAYHAEGFRRAFNGLQRKMDKPMREKREREALANLSPDSRLTRGLYAKLTGACRLGMREFCEQFGLKNRRSIKVKDLLRIMPDGTFGKNILVKAVSR